MADNKHTIIERFQKKITQLQGEKKCWHEIACERNEEVRQAGHDWYYQHKLEKDYISCGGFPSEEYARLYDRVEELKKTERNAWNRHEKVHNTLEMSQHLLENYKNL